MKIEDIMSRSLKTCMRDHTLDCAARIMWENDCGVVPIVDNAGRVVGMITDRDICFAVLTQNRLLGQIRADSVAIKPVITVRANESAQQAEALMQRHQLRRLPVVNDSGKLIGILSLNDLARASGQSPRDLPSEEIMRTLAAISQPTRGMTGARAQAT